MTFGGSSGGRWRGVLLATLLVALPRAAGADDQPATGPSRFGAGWHAGNGLGTLGGSVAVQVTDLVAVELQLGHSEEVDGAAEVTKNGVACLARVSLPRDGWTPFFAAGASVRRATFGPLSITQPALFANVGPEWRRPSGLRFAVGVGAIYARAMRASNDSMWLEGEGGVALNLELAVRYMFL